MTENGVTLCEKELLQVLPGLDGECIKLYIYIKYLVQKDSGRTSCAQVSDFLNMSEEAAQAAAQTLARQGLIHFGAKGVITLCAPAAQYEPLPPEPPKYLPGEVGALVEADEQLSDMLAFAQKILGRMLSYSAVERLYGLYDWLGMTPQLILRLLEYCAELGKRDMRYIEKVAVSWHEMGISSVEDAEQYIKRQNYKRSYIYRIQKEFGIADRKLTAVERRYIEEWYLMGVSLELASFAYDYSVSKTGRLAMAYINKVLLAWTKDGIHTAQQAQESIKKHSEEATYRKNDGAARGLRETKQFEVYNSGRYDYSEIDKLARQKLKQVLGKE